MYYIILNVNTDALSKYNDIVSENDQRRLLLFFRLAGGIIPNNTVVEWFWQNFSQPEMNVILRGLSAEIPLDDNMFRQNYSVLFVIFDFILQFFSNRNEHANVRTVRFSYNTGDT